MVALPPAFGVESSLLETVNSGEEKSALYMLIYSTNIKSSQWGLVHAATLTARTSRKSEEHRLTLECRHLQG